jgi:O-acetyl-ADP-ribose deacetylase (regulator of RNase III)
MATAVKIFVPVGVVDALKNQPRGINPTIDDIRKKHLIEASFDGKNLEISGAQEEILDLMNEHLHQKAGKADASNITLGDNGTVEWKLKNAKPFQSLFDEELEVIQKQNITKTTKGEDIILTCKYPEYKSMKTLLEVLEKKIKKCINKTLKVESKYVALAKSFHQHIVKNKWCCEFNDKQGANLKFYGRTKNDCEDGVSNWECYIKQQQALTPSAPRASLVGEPIDTGTSNSLGKTEQTLQMSTSELTPKTMKSDWDETQKHASANSLSPQTVTGLKTSGISKTMTKNQTSISKSEMQNMSMSQQNSLYATASGEDTKSSSNVKKTPGRTTGSGDAAKYNFQIENITFYIYKQSITEIKGMDAITNAANERLMHGGGVAYYISKAAGKKMDQDCDSYITKNGMLKVTKNYVSIPGDMKCEGIIHAVGPTWYGYKDKEDECARDLYKTIKNILRTASDKKYQRVALSAISSGKDFMNDYEIPNEYYKYKVSFQIVLSI